MKRHFYPSVSVQLQVERQLHFQGSSGAVSEQWPSAYEKQPVSSSALNKKTNEGRNEWNARKRGNGWTKGQSGDTWRKTPRLLHARRARLGALPFVQFTPNGNSDRKTEKRTLLSPNSSPHPWRNPLDCSIESTWIDLNRPESPRSNSMALTYLPR